MPLPRLPTPPKLGSLPRPPRAERPPVRPRGPKLFQLGRDPGRLDGPGDPPTDFVTAHTSRDEWVWYWAMAKVTRDPADPRRPPYAGGANWVYQKALDGGRAERGGSVCDFVYSAPNGEICIRIQTARWHIMAHATKQAQDAMLKAKTSRYIHVVDTYSQEWIEDATGEAACRAVARALKGISAPDPIRYGTARNPRP